MIMSTCAIIQKVHINWEYSFLKNDPGLVAYLVVIHMPLEDDFCYFCEYVFSGLTKWICSHQLTWKQALGED